jgi:twitching motility protein PilT
MDITELLAFAVKNKASDLHLSSGLPPLIRVHGDIRRINLPPMEHEDVHAMVYDIMSDAQRKMYEEFLECDFSFAVPNLARFRVNAFNQQRGAAANDSVIWPTSRWLIRHFLDSCTNSIGSSTVRMWPYSVSFR